MKGRDLKELDRRAFLRRAAVTGAAAAWAAPVVQSIAATPAFAQTAGGSPVADDCFKSTLNQAGTSCISACTAACTAAGVPGGGNACNNDPQGCNPLGNGPCFAYCPPGQGGDNPCCNPGLCDVGNFTCVRVGNCTVATYGGPTSGC